MKNKNYIFPFADVDDEPCYKAEGLRLAGDVILETRKAGFPARLGQTEKHYACVVTDSAGGAYLQSRCFTDVPDELID